MKLICEMCGEPISYDISEDEEYDSYGEFTIVKENKFAALQYGLLCPKCFRLPQPRFRYI